MNRRRIIFPLAAILILGCALAIFFDIFVRSHQQGSSSRGDQIPLISQGTLPVVTSSFITGFVGALANNETSSVAAPTSSVAPQSGSAFVSGENNNVVLPQNPTQPSSSPLLAPTGAAPAASGIKVSTLGQVQNIIASSVPAEKPTTTALLALPDVPDSEITISPSGVSTALDYLTYFSAHAENTTFDYKKFNSVLKDKNGIILSPQDLIDKAIADNDFSEVTSSLSVQEEFIQTEISFLKSIPVSGNAVAINKENIGLEELMSNLIDKALAVSSGSISEDDFISYNQQFDATANSARQSFIAESGILSLNKPMSFWDRILAALGIRTITKAQGLPPFGGQITFLLDCPCDLGTLVTIGPPVPVILFVPEEFQFTPLFFDNKNMSIGAWWLGLYVDAPIPCLVPSGPSCAPDGSGNEIIMTGTS
jgi:hypothetical protein